MAPTRLAIGVCIAILALNTPCIAVVPSAVYVSFVVVCDIIGTTDTRFCANAAVAIVRNTIRVG